MQWQLLKTTHRVPGVWRRWRKVRGQVKRVGLRLDLQDMTESQDLCDSL